MTPDYANYPLIEALKARRSRRFCLGMELPGGPLAYKSSYDPRPLSAPEEALLAFAGCGVTGHALADLAFNGDQGGNIMAGLAGRTVASGDGIQAVSLFMINDEGTFVFRRPQDMLPQDIPELIRSAQQNKFQEIAEKTRVRLQTKRVAPPSDPIFNINANRWSAQAKGTTCFLPVNELTFMYINGLLEILNEHTGVFVLDERAGFRPAGVGRFAKSRGGHLHDNPSDQRLATVAVVERLVTEFVTIEQGMMLQNIGLMAQALGLGSFPNFANHDFGWFEAIGFEMQNLRVSDYLGMRGLARLGIKLLGKDSLLPVPIGLNGKDFVLRSYIPPYFKDMREAVLAVVAHKCGERGVFRGRDWTSPWVSPNVAKQIEGPSEKAIEATVAYCQYIWQRYHRFPALMAPFRTVVGIQAGHLDLEFYEKFYRGEALSSAQHEDFAATEKQRRS